MSQVLKVKVQILHIDIQFVEYSYDLMSKRIKFLEDIKSLCTETFKNIFSQDHQLHLEYETKFELNRESIKQYFVTQREKDIIMYLKKIQYIIFPFLLNTIFWIIILGSFTWFFTIKNEYILWNEEVLQVFVPF